jgi:LysM repeat protein
MRLVRPQMLRRLLVAGVAVVLAACEPDGGGSTTRPRRSSSVASSTTVAPTTSTTPPSMTYQVKRGDTLTSIARFFHVSTEVLIFTNQLASGDQIVEGQVLQIPPAPPVVLTITPPEAPAGTVFAFNLTGAIAGEPVTFEITAPDGTAFIGPPHPASPDGVVTASYRSAGDTPGTYNVTATGERGTSVVTSFTIGPT